MQKKKKIIVSDRQIALLAENEFEKLRNGDDEGGSEDIETIAAPEAEEGGEEEQPATSGLDRMIGEPDDRRIEYPAPGDLEAIKMDKDPRGDGEDGGSEDAIDPKDMKSPPHELLDYLDKIEEAKSILSKVAAKEDNDNIKNRIYSHYEKAQKLAFELIKEFGIVH